ncbi:Carboxyl/Cholinesterase 29 [Frankliniella occidentalis]|nr:Carboxyl/Cholinesterase 29 [Frankliniella occidentalis]
MFRAAIQLSGVANSAMAYTERNMERAGALATRLAGNVTLDAAGVERVLLQAPYEAIARESFYMFYNSGWGLKHNPFVFSPELRPPDAEPRELSRHPESLLRDPAVPRVATLTGVLSREGLLTSNPLERNPEKLSLFVRNFAEYLRADCMNVSEASINLVEEITARIKQRFFQGQDPSPDYSEMLANLVGDLRYVYPLYRWVRTLDSQKAPMYLYLFDVVDGYNYQRMNLTTNVTGAVHADDLGYLFRVTATELHQNISAESRSAFALREHVRLITDFAKTLSSPLLEGHDVAADPARRRRPPYLHFGASFTMTRVENTFGAEDRMAFWDQIVDLMAEDRAGAGSVAAQASGPGLPLWLAALVAVLAFGTGGSP